MKGRFDMLFRILFTLAVSTSISISLVSAKEPELCKKGKPPQQVECLRSEVKKLSIEVAKLRDLSDKFDNLSKFVVLKGNGYKLESMKWGGECLSQTNAGTATSENCNSAPMWVPR
jgi:hypothetical protein